MSLKTHESLGVAKIVTYDGIEIFLTQEEYDMFLLVIDPPKNLTTDQMEAIKQIKYLNFDDGGISISDIRRYETTKIIGKDRQLKAAPIWVEESPDLTPEQKKRAKENFEKLMKGKKMPTL